MPCIVFDPFRQDGLNCFELHGERALLCLWCPEQDEWLPPVNDNGLTVKRPVISKPKLRIVSNEAGQLEPDRAEAERFLSVLDPTATSFTFQSVDDNKARKDANRKKRAEVNERRKAKGLEPLKGNLDPFAHVFNGTLDKYWSELVRLNGLGAGIFITINETDVHGRKTENIERVRALFNDLDGVPLEPVLQSETPPHIVVETSPGHFHPYRLVTGVTLDQFTTLQKGLIERFGGDDVSDLSRVMRLPGFLHRKSAPVMVHIVSTRDGPPYTAADFTPASPSKAGSSSADNAEASKNYLRIDQINRDALPRSPTQRLNDLAMANFAAWVPEIFSSATVEKDGGYRVTSASLARNLEEDISLHPTGIKDFGVHDMGDPREGKRTPIDIVMEWVFKVPIEEIADRSNEAKFKQACDWLRERLPQQEETKQTKKAKKEDDKNKPPEYQSYFIEELQTRPVVPLKWLVEDFILAGKLNGLFGEGAVGKDYIMLQLAIAMTCGAQWLGHNVMQGKVMYFPCEDDDDDVRRREDKITTYYASHGVYRPVPKQLQITPLLGQPTVLATYNPKTSLVIPTPAYTTLCTMVANFGPDLVIVGNRVNIFAVNQNDDSQARQCMDLLAAICKTYNTAIIMPGHPSQMGTRTGEGTSGSVQWSNACRMRTYLHRIKDDDETEPDPDMRQLEVMKTNHTPTGKFISMEWRDGLFQPDMVEVEKQQPQDAAAADADDEEEVLRLFDGLVKGAHVSPNLNAPNNIVARFLKHSQRFKRRGRKNLEAAVKRLYDKGTLDTVIEGSPSHQRSKVVKTAKKT